MSDAEHKEIVAPDDGEVQQPVDPPGSPTLEESLTMESFLSCPSCNAKIPFEQYDSDESTEEEWTDEDQDPDTTLQASWTQDSQTKSEAFDEKSEPSSEDSDGEFMSLQE